MANHSVKKTRRGGFIIFALFRKRGCRPQTAGDIHGHAMRAPTPMKNFYKTQKTPKKPQNK